MVKVRFGYSIGADANRGPYKCNYEGTYNNNDYGIDQLRADCMNVRHNLQAQQCARMSQDVFKKFDDMVVDMCEAFRIVICSTTNRTVMKLRRQCTNKENGVVFHFYSDIRIEG